MNNLIERLKQYENDVDLPNDLKKYIQRHLENKVNECDISSDEYDKYQAALDHISKLGLPVPKAKPLSAPVGSCEQSNEYYSKVRDLINSLK